MKIAMPSNTPTSTIGGQSLSPSNESRFVPHSSLQTSPVIANDRSHLADNDAGETTNPPNLIDDDDKSLLVGATICFTPEQSPRSSPMKDTANKRAALDLTPLECESALGSNATINEYIGSLIIDGSRVSANVMHTTSSLDGNSTTEYEILDKSLEIEDLNLDEDDNYPHEDGGGVIKKGEEVVAVEVAAVLENMSPTSSLLSLGSGGGGSVSKEVATSTMAASNVANSSPDSPKVDQSPLTPFKNLHKFWEGQSKPNEDVSDKSDKDVVTASNASSSLYSAASNIAATFIFSVYVVIGLMTRRCATSMLNAAKYCALAVLRKDDKRAVLSSIKATKQNSSAKVTLDATLSKLCGVVISWLSAAKDGLQSVLRKKNLSLDPEATDGALEVQASDENSKLFSDDTVPVVPLLALGGNKKDSSGDIATAEPLDMKEVERLRKINSGALNIASTFNKIKTVASQFAFSIVGRICFSFFLTFMVMVELRMFLNNNLTAKEVVVWDILLCVDTNDVSFDSIPMWEFILSSAAFDATSSTASSNSVLIFIGYSIFASSLIVYLRMKMSYNTGYWTDKEHHQFLKGYAKHGKDWDAVAKYVPTRSLKQVKNHGCYWLSIRSPGKAHPFSPKAIKVKKEAFSPNAKTPMSDPVKRVKVLRSPTITDPVKRAKMRLLDKGGQDTSEE